MYFYNIKEEFLNKQIKTEKMAKAQTAPVAKVELTIAGVKALLKEGVDRDGIAAKYGLKKSQVNLLFKDERLKGLKVKRERVTVPAFIILDDVNAGAVTAEEGVTNGAVETSNASAESEAEEAGKW
jgi:hypothetical protein